MIYIGLGLPLFLQGFAPHPTKETFAKASLESSKTLKITKIAFSFLEKAKLDLRLKREGKPLPYRDMCEITDIYCRDRRPSACFWQACQVRFANIVNGPFVMQM